jgi:regulator of RNase E activity RraB
MVSPIPQMDGEAAKDKSKDTIYHFVSDYGEENMDYTLEEHVAAKKFSLLSRMRLKPLFADHECTVALTATSVQSYIWPEMIGIQTECAER